MRTLDDANKEVEQFKKGSLRQRVSSLEKELVGKDKTGCPFIYSEHVIGSSLLDSAVALKRAAGQVNEVVHAIGILLSLPHILRDEETIQSLSLAAGNIYTAELPFQRLLLVGRSEYIKRTIFVRQRSRTPSEIPEQRSVPKKRGCEKGTVGGISAEVRDALFSGR